MTNDNTSFERRQEPRRFGLTRKQFETVFTILGIILALAIVVPLTAWAHNSLTGFIVLCIIAVIGVSFHVLYKRRTGRWFDEPPPA